MTNSTTALNPNPPKLSSGAQIRAGRALLGWRRIDLAAAAGLHRNAVAYWERRVRLPRREPFACEKIRAALRAAGVVTVATPAPGVCLLATPARDDAKLISVSEAGAPDRDEIDRRT